MEELKVRKQHWISLTIGIAIVLGIYAVPAITQQQPAPAAAQLPYLIAVIDVTQVIKAHPDFKMKQAALQEKIKKAEADFTARQKVLGDKQKGLEGLKSNTPEYQRLYEEITNDMAILQKDAKNQERLIILENSQIMYDTYKEIKAAVDKYASARGIAQVTDYREFEPDPSNPNSVAEDMDQRLVWYNKRLNITNFILTDIYAVRQKTWDPQAASQQQPLIANPNAQPQFQR